MRKLHCCFLVLLISTTLTSGCAINLPFNHRLDYNTVQDAKAIPVVKKVQIALKWIPSTFPDRIDVQGASGFVGGGSQTRIPTGVALADRILEVLDVMIGVDKLSVNVLTINVIEAKSEFEYSAGFFNVTPAIDVGRCVFEAEFIYGDKRWKEKFTSEKKDPKIGGTSQTGLLEAVWDDIALQVGRNVSKNI